MYKTMQALITDIERALYQSAGPAVQLYSQDVIMQMVQDAFDHLFTKRWWPQFRKREVLSLDGSTGYATTLPVNMGSYEDIRYVYASNSSVPLPSLPLAANTTGQQYTVGTNPRWVEGDADKVLRVWPATAQGTILLVGRKRPTSLFALTDTVPFDSTLIKHFAVWSYFVDDGSNPAATAKHQGLFETRLTQIEEDNFNEPIQLDAASGQYPNQWYESRY